jgi:S-adenosylmethionine synthetase
MKKASKLITTECVSFGHPDKVADQISDAILDAYLAQDKDAKIAVETMVKDQIVVLGGEVTSKAVVDIDKVVREAVKEVGFTKEQGFYWEDIKILNLIGKQSPEINRAVVHNDEELGAGDQGFMVGYAINDTPNAMPVGMYVARKLCDYVVKVKGLGKDLKTQVTVEEFDSNVKRIDAILISTMHNLKEYNLEQLTAFLKDSILTNKMGLENNIFGLIDVNTKIFINPAGSWSIGGPVADCGLTGRKIVVDQYGASCTVGGGAFSGKDYSKSDRAGAYLCRYVAKNIVKAGIAHECKVEIAYMIGVAEPVSVNLEMHDSNKQKIEISEELKEQILNMFPLTPSKIIKKFSMKEPMYFQTAKNGHFGNEIMPWEQTDLAEKLKSIIS